MHPVWRTPPGPTRSGDDTGDRPDERLHGVEVVRRASVYVRADRTDRSGARAGAGRTPVARSTASGNFAGCAVESVTIGRSPPNRRAAAVPVAVCGSISRPVSAYTRAISASVSRSSNRAARNEPSMNVARWSGSTLSRPDVRNRLSCSAVMPPSRPFISNSSRSKLDDTWMSMLGLSVGTTGRADMSPSLTKRVRMSFSLDGDDEVGDRCAHLTGDPSRQYVAEVAGRHAERRLTGERLRRGDVVDDLGHHARPVDRVDGRQPQLVAEHRVAEHRLDQVLAVVEVPVDREGVHVRAVDRRHLAPLDVARPTGRVEDHDVDVIAARSPRRWPPSRCRRSWHPRS